MSSPKPPSRRVSRSRARRAKFYPAWFARQSRAEAAAAGSSGVVGRVASARRRAARGGRPPLARGWRGWGVSSSCSRSTALYRLADQRSQCVLPGPARLMLPHQHHHHTGALPALSPLATSATSQLHVPLPSRLARPFTSNGTTRYIFSTTRHPLSFPRFLWGFFGGCVPNTTLMRHLFFSVSSFFMM